MYQQISFSTAESLTVFLNERNISKNQIINIQYCPNKNYGYQWVLIYYK